LILEDYNVSLKKRDVPGTFLVTMKCQQELFDECYGNIPSEVMMKDVHLSWKAQNWKAFCKKFKKVVDELDARFMMIREFREELFKWDELNSIDAQFDINSPVPLSDERIVWDKEKPNLGPLTKEQYDKANGAHDSDDSDDFRSDGEESEDDEDDNEDDN
jgi:hypothetical protein